MVYLIDGNNLLYAAHAHAAGTQIGRQQLCVLVGRWAQRAGSPATIVFDGPPPRESLEHQMRATRVQLIFSAPRSADEVIEEIIQTASAPSRIHVVTGDRAIQSVARYHRCHCIESDGFARELATPHSDLPPPPPPSEREKPDDLPPDESAEWMREFGYDSDDGPAWWE